MRNSAELEFGLTGGSLWQPHCPQDQPALPGGFGIDPRLGAATLRAPAASKEDYRSQAILKLHCPSGLDYRVRHELQNLIADFIFVRNQGDLIFLWNLMQSNICITPKQSQYWKANKQGLTFDLLGKN